MNFFIKKRTFFSDYEIRNKAKDLYHQKKYLEALEIISKLSSQKNIDYSLKSNCYMRLNDTIKATNVTKKKLYNESNKDFSFFVEYSNKKLLEITGISFQSRYTFLGGFENYGMIIHSNKNIKKYITIINKANKNPLNKKYYIWLKQLSSNYLNGTLLPILITDNYEEMVLDTYEYIDTSNASNDVGRIIETSRKIESCPYPLNTVRKMNRKNNISIYYFRLIKYKSIITMIFKEIYKISNNKNAYESIRVFKKLENIIDKNKLYKKVNKSFFSVCHGNYSNKNIVYKREKNKYFVIDNNHYSFSLKGYDIANYISHNMLNFEEIKEKIFKTYINDFCEENLHAWELFFSIMLCYNIVTNRNNTEIDIYYSTLFNPMLDYFSNIYE